MMKDKIIQYFRSSEKEHDNFKINVDFQHFIVNNKDLKSIDYQGNQGIETLLKQLEGKGWQGIYENEALVGLTKDGSTINLKAGCQLELSIKDTYSIKEVDNTYLKFLQDLFPLLEKNNQHMLAVGYLPASKITDVGLSPEKKYQYLAQYMENRGLSAVQMLKGMAGTCLSFNYAHQDDFRKKIQVAYALHPVMAALFDNSPVFEGQVYEGYSLRSKLQDSWEKDRGTNFDIMKGDLGYDDYAEILLKTPPIFIKEGSEYIYTGEKTLEELYQDRELTEEVIDHTASMAFFALGLKNCIELRMVDALPYPLNLAYITLWKSLLYNQENLDALYEFTMTISQQEIEKAKEDLIEEGLEAKLGQGTLRDLAKDLFFMAGHRGNPGESHYLQPLEAVIFKEIVPKEITLRHLKELKG